MQSIHVHDYIRAERPRTTIDKTIATEVAIVLHMRRVHSKFASAANGTEVKIAREILSRASSAVRLVDFSHF